MRSQFEAENWVICGVRIDTSSTFGAQNQTKLSQTSSRHTSMMVWSWHPKEQAPITSEVLEILTILHKILPETLALTPKASLNPGSDIMGLGFRV